MIRKLLLATMLAPLFAFADDVEINKVKFVGPFEVCSPVIIDSVSVDGTKYSDDLLIDTPVSFESLKGAAEVSVADINASASSLNIMGFSFSIASYSNLELKLEGAKQSKVFIGNEEVTRKTGFAPGQYDVKVKFVADTTDLKVTLSSDKALTLVPSGGKRPFDLDDNMGMRYYYAVSLSPSGKYLRKAFSYYNKEGEYKGESSLTELSTGRVVIPNFSYDGWMPGEDKYYNVKRINGSYCLETVDVATGRKEIVARDIPTDMVTISPTGDYLIYTKYIDGPRKPDDVYEIVHPDDRQSNFRKRAVFGKYDFKTGMAQPLVYGWHSAFLEDISSDGKYLLFAVSQDSITQRPSELLSFYRMNVETMETELLVDREGFVSAVEFYPGTADKVLFTGTPDAFGGVGSNLPADMTASMYDIQLFQMELPSRKVTPLTRDFDPSISSTEVSKADGMIYFTAENADSVSLYRLDPATLKITQLSVPTEVITNFFIAENAPVMAFSGNSTCVPDRLYSLTLGKKQKLTLVEDLNSERMAELQIGQCHEYRFTTSRGYDVSGYYVLPPNMDKSKKYPVIVDYYGGCSPTSHRFGGGTHYPQHYWNALGYIVLIVNPSGAAGFGQEWAARHVNTAGEGVAEDIIEATEWFADNHAFVNKEKIGCVSASYGGFMTQTLLSKTDLYACGISHAGISSHTSYWGEGYWGYSYSEVSMANSYPWNRKDLYVERSPIYNADKIHKPILFTHGTADTNVPIGESIQMYTAMKILGVPTAFVMVEGENHGIMDYSKRKKWINTMVAWFQRWLQDDDSWWNAMYPEVKN